MKLFGWPALERFRTLLYMRTSLIRFSTPKLVNA